MANSPVFLFLAALGAAYLLLLVISNRTFGLKYLSVGGL